MIGATSPSQFEDKDFFGGVDKFGRPKENILLAGMLRMYIHDICLGRLQTLLSNYLSMLWDSTILYVQYLKCISETLYIKKKNLDDLSRMTEVLGQ